MVGCHDEKIDLGHMSFAELSLLYVAGVMNYY